MTGFPMVELTDICHPKQWPTISGNELTESGYPVYGANGRIGYYSHFNHEEPTVLITCRGATCGTINISEPKSYVTGNAMALDSLDERRVDRNYLARALRLEGLLRKSITGSAQPQITRQSLQGVTVPLPPLAEQKRIAAVLDTVDTLRTKRRQAIALLGDLEQAIFRDMFGDLLTNPRGFEVRPLIQLVDEARPITYGILKPGDDILGGVPYVRVIDMKNGGIDSAGLKRTTVAIDQQYRRSRLRSGDILLSIRGHVGRLARVPAALDGANITQDTARISVSEGSVGYVMACLRSTYIQRWMENFTKGAAIKGINLTDVKKIPIPVPPAEEQRRFARRLEAFEGIAMMHRTHLATLDELFVSLQQRAFAGELWDHEAA